MKGNPPKSIDILCNFNFETKETLLLIGY